MSPLRPLFPATLLMLALLVAPSGARADFAPTASHEQYDYILKLGNPEYLGARVDTRSCGSDQPRTMIAATTASKRHKRCMYSNDVCIETSYGDNIPIFCSSNDTSNLTIRDGDHKLQAEHLNSTTIQLTLIKPDVGEYKYYCTDSNTTCTHTLHVYVLPAMSVMAPHVRHTRVLDGISYFVPRGESYNVYCSAQQTSKLTAGVYFRDTLQIKSLNVTTLKAITVLDHTEGDRDYFCTSSSSSPPVRMIVRVTVDYYPEARNFQCVLYASNLILECWWKTTTERNTFKLLVLYDHYSSAFVCLDRSRALTAGCAYDYRWRNDDDTISFQLETCNTVFCSNQTFGIDQRSITKLNPVINLKVVNTSPQGATVAWHKEFYSMHKVEYRLLGTVWRAVNASTLRCDYSFKFISFSYDCELQLALPCPDAHYELRVYVRYMEATLDMYWSDPATLFFFTAPSTGGEVDPACGADFREPEPTPSVRIVALHDVRELISDDRKEERALKKYINGLKQTLAEIKALMDAQK